MTIESVFNSEVYCLLTECKDRTVKYLAGGFEVQTELAKSVHKKGARA